MNFVKKMTTFVVAAASCITVANAAETWQARLYGADGGLATGWLPPEGVYFVSLTGLAPNDPVKNGAGNNTGVKSNIYLTVPELVWVTPFQILGAKYAFGIAEVIDSVDARVPTAAGALSLGGGGTMGTYVMPGSLSWSLPNNLFFDARVMVAIPSGNYRDPLIYAGGNLPSINYFAVDTALSLSWMHDGWTISGRVYYTANTKDQIIDYRSGNVLGTEETISKRLGKWTIGVTGFTQNQVQKDTGAAVAELYGPSALISGRKMSAYGVGGLVGYDFGPVIAQGWCDAMIRATYYAGGDLCYVRLIVPLTHHETAAPVVAAKY
jgi:hypothetical protein